MAARPGGLPRPGEPTAPLQPLDQGLMGRSLRIIIVLDEWIVVMINGYHGREPIAAA
jgi:hypothetical protein